MLELKMEQLSFHYENNEGLQQTLLTDINGLVHSHSRIGLLGANGSGKSTLFRLLVGELKAHSGQLIKRDGLKIALLEQDLQADHDELVEDVLWQFDSELFRLRLAIRNFLHHGQGEDSSIFASFAALDGYRLEAQIDAWLAELGLRPECLQQTIGQLSGGERTKLTILRLLLKNADLWLLDEPSNHLDTETLNWLCRFLLQSNKPFIVISHDRWFLDQTVEEIWQLQEGDLRCFAGNYSAYAVAVEAEQQSATLAYQVKSQEVARLRQSVQEKRQSANRMEKFKASRSRKKNGGLCQRDEGSGSARVNVSKPMRTVKAVEKRIENILAETEKPFRSKERHIVFPVHQVSPSQNLLQVQDLCKSFDERILLENLSFRLERQARLAISGANGSGKSTIIRILAGLEQADSGLVRWSPSAVVSYFFQDDSLEDGDKTAMETVWQGERGEAETLARTVLGSLGMSAQQIQKPISSLSPGERSKVRLVKTTLSGANVLVLDEPTNHLEITGRLMLENALRHFEGAVILVSHDQQLLESIGAQLLCLKNKQ
ncbi:MAG: ribosomal protection-like ABC-F family protein [Oligoflexus sp.]